MEEEARARLEYEKAKAEVDKAEKEAEQTSLKLQAAQETYATEQELAGTYQSELERYQDAAGDDMRGLTEKERKEVKNEANHYLIINGKWTKVTLAEWRVHDTRAQIEEQNRRIEEKKKAMSYEQERNQKAKEKLNDAKNTLNEAKQKLEQIQNQPAEANRNEGGNEVADNKEEQKTETATNPAPQPQPFVDQNNNEVADTIVDDAKVTRDEMAAKMIAEREKYFALAETAPGMDENGYKVLQNISKAFHVITGNAAGVGSNEYGSKNRGNIFSADSLAGSLKDGTATKAVVEKLVMAISGEYQKGNVEQFKTDFNEVFKNIKNPAGFMIDYLKGGPTKVPAGETKSLDVLKTEFAAAANVLNSKFPILKQNIDAVQQPPYKDVKMVSAEVIKNAKPEDMLELKSMKVEDAMNIYVESNKQQLNNSIKRLNERIQNAHFRGADETALVSERDKLNARLTDQNFDKKLEKEFNEMWNQLKGQNKEHGRVFADDKTGKLYMTAPLPEDMLNYDKATGNVSFKGQNGIARIPKSLCLPADEVAKLTKDQKEGNLPQFDASFTLSKVNNEQVNKLQAEVDKIDAEHKTYAYEISRKYIEGSEPTSEESAKLENLTNILNNKREELDTIKNGLPEINMGIDAGLIAKMQELTLNEKNEKGKEKRAEIDDINSLSKAFYQQAMASGAKNHVQALMVTKLRLLTMNPIPGKDGQVHNLTPEQFHKINETFDAEINKHLMFLPNSESSNLIFQQQQAGKALANCFEKSNINIQDIPYFLQKNGLELKIPNGAMYLDMAHIFTTGGFKTLEEMKDAPAKNNFAMTDKTHTGARVWGQTQGFRDIMNDPGYVSKWTSTANKMKEDPNFKANRIAIYQAAIHEMMTLPPNGADAGALAAMVTVINNGGMTLEELCGAKPVKNTDPVQYTWNKESEARRNNFYRLTGTKDIGSLSASAGSARTATMKEEQTAGVVPGTMYSSPTQNNATFTSGPSINKDVVGGQTTPVTQAGTDAEKSAVAAALAQYNKYLEERKSISPRNTIVTPVGDEVNGAGRFMTNKAQVSIILGLCDGQYTIKNMRDKKMINNISLSGDPVSITDILEKINVGGYGNAEKEGLKNILENNNPKLDAYIIEKITSMTESDIRKMFVAYSYTDKTGRERFDYRLNGEMVIAIDKEYIGIQRAKAEKRLRIDLDVAGKTQEEIDEILKENGVITEESATEYNLHAKVAEETSKYETETLVNHYIKTLGVDKNVAEELVRMRNEFSAKNNEFGQVISRSNFNKILRGKETVYEGATRKGLIEFAEYRLLKGVKTYNAGSANAEGARSEKELEEERSKIYKENNLNDIDGGIEKTAMEKAAETTKDSKIKLNKKDGLAPKEALEVAKEFNKLSEKGYSELNDKETKRFSAISSVLEKQYGLTPVRMENGTYAYDVKSVEEQLLNIKQETTTPAAETAAAPAKPEELTGEEKKQSSQVRLTQKQKELIEKIQNGETLTSSEKQMGKRIEKTLKEGHGIETKYTQSGVEYTRNGNVINVDFVAEAAKRDAASRNKQNESGKINNPPTGKIVMPQAAL